MMDPELLGRLLDEQAARLELYASQWTAAAEDVVQEAFIELARQRDLPHEIVPWLYRVVRNRAISRVRSAQRRRRHEETAAAWTEQWFVATPMDVIDAQAAAEELQSLPKEQREVIVARIWGQLSFEQIAGVVGISSSAAHRRYVAGLETLREKLGVTWLRKS